MDKCNVGKKGFTLIELLIVIVIISLTASLVMPSLWDTAESSLKSEAKRISNTLRYIYDEATGKKQDYLLKIDIDNATWRFESNSETRKFEMKKDVMFKDIYIPSHGEVSRGELVLVFGPLGPAEPVIFHLIKDEIEYTVQFNHLNGRAKVFEGYIL